jgi:O-antigen/teichoic acid export membrane protein
MTAMPQTSPPDAGMLDETDAKSAGVRGLGANSAFGALGLLFPSAVIVAAYPLVLGGIGPAAMGVFILVSTLAPLLLVIDLGIAQATTHAIASRSVSLRSIRASDAVATSAAFYLAAGVFAALVTWIASPWLARTFGEGVDHESVLWAFRIGSVNVVAAFLLLPVSATFKGLLRFDLVAMLASGVALLTLGGATLSTVIRADLVNAVLGFTLGQIVAVGLGYAYVRSALADAGVATDGARPSWMSFHTMRRFGWPLMVASVASVLMYYPQRLLIGATIGPSAVTVYQLAAVIPSRVQALIATATEALFPFASSAPPRDRLRHEYLRFLLIGGALAFGLLLTTVLARDWILGAWIGGTIADDVADLIPITSAAYFLITLSAAPYYLGIGLGRPYLVASVYAAAGVLNVSILLLSLIGGASLFGVALIFLGVNVLASAGYQAITELVLWRGHALRSERSLGA